MTLFDFLGIDYLSFDEEEEEEQDEEFNEEFDETDLIFIY